MTDILAFLALLSLALLLGAYVRHVVRDDGYHGRPQQPPRSRPLDHFDPWSGAGRTA